MKEQSFVPREFDIFGGLDVDKKSIAVTLMIHQGILQSFSMPYRAEHLLSYVGKHFTDKKVPRGGACMKVAVAWWPPPCRLAPPRSD
jgi:hypothetical protein